MIKVKISQFKKKVLLIKNYLYDMSILMKWQGSEFDHSLILGVKYVTVIR